MTEKEPVQTATAAQVKSACLHPEAVGTRWGDPISEVRREELKALADQQHEWADRDAPERSESVFNEVVLTGADVFWLASYALADRLGNIDIMDVQERLRRYESTYEIVLTKSHSGKERRITIAPDLSSLHLEGADLSGAHLEEALLLGAHMEGGRFNQAYLTDAVMVAANLEETIFRGAHIEKATCSGAQMRNADLGLVHLEQARLDFADLAHARLLDAHLEGASLFSAVLDAANLYGAHLEGTHLVDARMERADLKLASFDKASCLTGALLTGAKFDQVTFDNTNLAVIDWSRVDTVGDEVEARKSRYVSPVRFIDEQEKTRDIRLAEFGAAVRANRVLAVALRAQGLNEDADRFAYRAQLCQRQVLRRQRRYAAALGSWFLDVISGHGYKPMRTLSVYLLAIVSFAVLYFALGQTLGPQLSPLGAFVFSMTSFHGRGFFPGGIALDDPITVLAAFEAFVGLVIEVSFIATFTQRFFAR